MLLPATASVLLEKQRAFMGCEGTIVAQNSRCQGLCEFMLVNCKQMNDVEGGEHSMTPQQVYLSGVKRQRMMPLLDMW